MFSHSRRAPFLKWLWTYISCLLGQIYAWFVFIKWISGFVQLIKFSCIHWCWLKKRSFCSLVTEIFMLFERHQYRIHFIQIFRFFFDFIFIYNPPSSLIFQQMFKIQSIIKLLGSCSFLFLPAGTDKWRFAISLNFHYYYNLLCFNFN